MNARLRVHPASHSAVDGFSNIAANSAFGSNPEHFSGSSVVKVVNNSGGVSEDGPVASREILAEEGGSRTQVDLGMA
jgi:hypothetical protein